LLRAHVCFCVDAFLFAVYSIVISDTMVKNEIPSFPNIEILHRQRFDKLFDCEIL